MAKELKEIIESKNIIDSEELLESLSFDSSFSPRIRPMGLVRISQSSEVAALVRWANETQTPLVPVSSGTPHLHGDTVPSVGGALIVDLSGLKQVIRIDKKNRVAMIEPGVTFGELIPQLARAGLRMNLPLVPRANKSVIASMIEREPVVMPLYQWDALDPLTCIEVVFGSGDSFRTGSASGPGSLEEQWKTGQAQVRPMGPGATDFARVVQGAQGTIGIVTWATLKCENLPDVQRPYVIGSDEYGPLADFAYRLMWNKAGDECLIFNRAQMAAIMGISAEEAARIRDILPSWILFFCLSGYKYAPEEKIAFKEKALVGEAKKIGVQFKGAVAGLSASRILKVLNRPSEEPYWKLRHKGGCQDLFFLSTLDRVPEFVRLMAETADQVGYPFSDIGIYVQPMVQGTSCHCEFDIFYDPDNKAERDKVEALYDRAGIALLNAGAYYSRPYGRLSDIAYRKDAEMTAAVRKLKTIFDPNNVMNTGKLCF